MRLLSGFLLGLLVLTAAACGEEEGPAANTVVGLPTEPPRPAAVQPDARFIAQPLVLGSIERRPNAAPVLHEARLITEFACEDDVFLIHTNNEDIWALIPCDRVTPLSLLEPYRQESAAIKLDPLGGKIRIETLGGAQAEFTVSAIWVYERPR